MTTTPDAPEKGWRTIESAPKDGSVFFAWCPNVGRVIMNIDGVHRNTWAVDRTYRLGCNPTHWMPLPPAPTPEASHD